MNFSKLKLTEAAMGSYSGLGTAAKAAEKAGQSGMTQKAPKPKNMQSAMSTSLMGNKIRDTSVSMQKTTEQYMNDLRREVEEVKTYESMKSDWRSELSEAVVDGQEREDHPYVTVMPTGDENLIQAIKQLKGEVKDKKEKAMGEGYAPGDVDEKLGAVTSIPKKEQEAAKERLLAKAKAKRMKKEEVEEIEEKRGLWDNIHAKRKRGEAPAKKGDKDYPKTLNVEETEALDEAKKKKCKDGYKWDSDEGKCVKKKKSSTTVIIGRGWGHGHHHDDDDKEDNNGGDDGGNGGDMGGGDAGGGVGEMFDYMGDLLLQEKEMSIKDQMALSKNRKPQPFDPDARFKQRTAQVKDIVKNTKMTQAQKDSSGRYNR